jgi:hypothetical protein
MFKHLSAEALPHRNGERYSAATRKAKQDWLSDAGQDFHPGKKNKFSSSPTLFGKQTNAAAVNFGRGRDRQRSRTAEAKRMNENLEPASNKSMTPAGTGTPGGRRPGLPTPAFWPCVGLVVAGAIRILVCGEVDLAGLSLLTSGLAPLVRFRNEW